MESVFHTNFHWNKLTPEHQDIIQPTLTLIANLLWKIVLTINLVQTIGQFGHS